MEEKERKSVIRLFLGTGLASAIALLVILEPLHGPWWLNFMIRLLEAIAISCVVGLLIEIGLTREFGREVFLASIGYLLPHELRPEMRWISTLYFMCAKDTIFCTLTRESEGCIRIKIERNQVVKNISAQPQSLPVGLMIDEWICANSGSQIHKFNYTKQGQRWPEGDTPTLDAKYLKKYPSSVLGVDENQIPKVELASDEEVTINSAFEEVKHINDEFRINIKYPTNKPHVNITNLADLGISVGFAHREGQAVQQIGLDFSCPFTLLPYQHIAIRWWDKKQIENWLNS